ncbi:MAG: energy transducer TonB [Candidatus Cloacimonetes bacterium]|nr:energy transducer TonB [Candidatus Cloacimonadota bacterium]
MNFFKKISYLFFTISIFSLTILSSEMIEIESIEYRPCGESVDGRGFFDYKYKPPILTKRVAVVYPIQNENIAIQGMVLLKVEILNDGTVGRILVSKSLQEGSGGLDEVAIEAVRQWEFEPAEYDGEIITCWISQGIRFKIED